VRGAYAGRECPAFRHLDISGVGVIRNSCNSPQALDPQLKGIIGDGDTELVSEPEMITRQLSHQNSYVRCLRCAVLFSSNAPAPRMRRITPTAKRAAYPARHL
jgi:hypothetical protein